MSRIYDAEIEKMRHLMGYGLNEGTSKATTPVVEYHVEAADGNTYGILRESNKFYIKVAPKKDTPVLAEDYDYIGGFMNKKENEYTTYAVASKQFDIKMKQIAESCGSKKVIEQFSKVEPAEWQINETKEMRAEIDRMNQISDRSKLIEEGKGCFTEGKKNDPYISTGVKEPNKETNDKKTDHTKTGKPFNEKEKETKNPMKPFINCPTEDTGVAGTKECQGDGKGKGRGDSKNLKESKVVRLTEEQVLAWSDNKDYMDKSHGTRVGKSNPFNDEVGCESNQCEADTDPIREGAVMHNSDNQNVPEPGTNDVGDGQPYEMNEMDNNVSDIPSAAGTTNFVNLGEATDADDVAGMPEEDEYEIDIDTDDDADAEDPVLYNDDEGFEGEGLPFPEAAEPEIASDDEVDALLNDWDKIDYDDYDDNPWESRSRGGEKIYEVVLNDFGKHPAFRKVPMTTPTHHIEDRYGKDWNDDSTKGDEPFAKKIGKGDPFTDKVTDMITDAVISAFGKKKV